MSSALSASSKAKATTYLKNLGFPVSAQEIDKILQGELVRVSIDTLTERELATAFAVVLPRSPEEVERIFLENLGKEDSDDSIQQLIKSGSDDKTLDFSSLKLLPATSAPAMVTQYVNPKSFADLNLSVDESALFHALNPKTASVEDVEQTLRKVLAHRLEEYQQKGLEGIAPYQRGRSAAFEPGKELMERCQKLKVLHNHAPEFAKFIMDYPNSKPPTGQIKESFTMMNFNIDDKPTYSLVHKVHYKRDDVFFVFHRHFYVSRGHNSVQAVGAGESVSDADAAAAPATILVFSSRTSTDQVAGFGGSAKRIIGSRIMGEKLMRNFSVLMEEMKNKQV